MKIMSPTIEWTVLALFAFSCINVGCANVSLIGRRTLPAGSGVDEALVTGYVVSLDPAEKLFVVRTPAGRERSIRYEDDTTVIREGREQLVTTLRRGERVTVQLTTSDQGGKGSVPSTPLIIVQRTE